MGNSAVGYARNGIDICIVSSCKHSAASVAHIFHIDALVGGCGITEIDPQKGTDPHFVLRLGEHLVSLCIHVSYFTRFKFMTFFVAEVDESGTLEGGAVGSVFFCYYGRCSSKFIPHHVDSVCRHEQK